MASRLNQILACEAMLLLSQRGLVAAQVEDVLSAAAHLDAKAVVATGHAALHLRAPLDAVVDGSCRCRGAWARPRASLALHRLLRACRVRLVLHLLMLRLLSVGLKLGALQLVQVGVMCVLLIREVDLVGLWALAWLHELQLTQLCAHIRRHVPSSHLRKHIIAVLVQLIDEALGRRREGHGLAWRYDRVVR